MLYLLLPLVHVFSDEQVVSFWGALKSNLAVQKTTFLHFYRDVRPAVLLSLVLTSLVPLFIIGSLILSTAQDTIDGDIAQVWQASAARRLPADW